ncbi:flavin-containing monooxygenase [Microbacterium sp. JB110]|uniref:flavin-containing monooxygenase n=1 Tax=Microbacterium sp. JB110 TaxID=2024477 RepID=UPI00097EC325|nr:NAD(P)/FAD-dependent oxidoreductase [Microbacterium sp. JB110]RCS57319.1 NAD(P)/FAD-dependent oxidoreductase [Microbacterium sp. JB110]SJM58219.1 Cyclohexanone monooxygenase [Frigoribacterium sp. JB110]
MSIPSSVRTVIVGAGFAGIAAGIALKRAGDDDFVILERADSAGGTWRDNRYPGVACDVPAHLYALESHPWPEWSRTFAPGGEIRTYLDHVIDDAGLRAHIRFSHELTDARWDGDGWAITVSAPVEIRSEHLVIACGRLTEPRVPQLPGVETFDGPVFHSARWPDGFDVAGKRIAVVGTGASAIQLAPALAGLGAAVTVFQRTPAWIMPRGDREHTHAELTAWRGTAGALTDTRAELYAEGEARFASRSGDTAAAEAASRSALAHLHAHVADPHLRAALTPDYAFGCKRVLLSDEFYPAIAAGIVGLEPSALAAVDDGELVAASGSRHSADAVVLATGFRATRQPYASRITGEHGSTLDEHWSGGFTAVASTLVHGFPNLSVLGGPNATLGHNSAVLLIEAQAALMAELVSRDGAPIRVSAAAENEAVREVDALAAGTPWLTGGCRNWYVDERSGRLTLIWPSTVSAFRERLDRVRTAFSAVPAQSGTSPA